MPGVWEGRRERVVPGLWAREGSLPTSVLRVWPQLGCVGGRRVVLEGEDRNVSTNSECAFVEVTPGAWYYVLEHTHAPKNSWDWREHASCYGAFASEDEADAHLRRHHANPGGSWTQSYAEGFKPDDVLAVLVSEATR